MADIASPITPKFPNPEGRTLKANLLQETADAKVMTAGERGQLLALPGNLRSKAEFAPPLRPAVYTNAVRNRFTPSAFAGAVVPGSSGSAPSLSLAFEQAAFDNYGQPGVIRMSDTVAAAATQPRFTIPITLADLALAGLVPSDNAPPRFSARGAIQRGTLVNQTIDGNVALNGIWYVVARYAGAGASLAGPLDPANDVAWVGNQQVPASIAQGQNDPIWNAGSTGSYVLTPDEKVLLRHNVPLRATYNGKALSGLILMFFGQAAAAGATAFSVGRVAIVPGATVDQDARYFNVPEDTASYVGASSLAPALAAQINGAALESSVAARLQGKVSALSPLKPATYANAVRNRFNASSFQASVIPNGGTATAISLVYEQPAYDNFGQLAVYRVTDNLVAAGNNPRFSIPISVADLALAGLVPSDGAPPTFSVRAAIQRGSLVNQTVDGSLNTNGIWYVILRYNGAGASLGGGFDPANDVLWLGNSVLPSNTGQGQSDPVWAVGSSGSYTLTADEKILVRNKVPLRATYNGKALSGAILVFFGVAPAAGAVAMSVGRVALVPGDTIDLNATYLNRPEDDLFAVGIGNFPPALVAQINGAAQETSVAARLAAKQEYAPPLKPGTYLNAVRKRYGSSTTLPGPHTILTGGGVGSLVATNVYSPRFWTTYGEPSAMKSAGVSTASGQNGPRCAYYVSLADLTAIGVVPSDGAPPVMSFSGAIDLAMSVAQNLTNSTGGGGQFWVCLRYAGAGAALEGTSYNSATDVIFANTATGASANGQGNGDAAFAGSTGSLTFDANEKAWKRQNVPIRATYNSQALSGILIVFFGTTAAASGATAMVTGRVAAVAGPTIDTSAATLNKPDDYVSAAVVANSVAYVDHDWIYDAATGTSLLTSATQAPPTTGVDYLFLVYGQSWALAANPSSAPLLTTVAQHSGKALMPAPGVIPYAPFTSYADLKESGTVETVCSGMADVIMTKLNTRVGAKPRAIFAVCGMGGQAIAGGDTQAGYDIGVGSDTFERAMMIIDSCYNTSKSAGRQLVVAAVVWMQGEQDYNDGISRWLYRRGLIRVRQAFDARIREVTGQKDAVMMYSYLTNRGYSTAFRSNEVAIAQLDATRVDPHMRTYGPVYWCPDGGDGSHSTPTGYRGMGNQAGNAIVEDLFGPYWEPMRVAEAYWSAANKFCLRYTMPVAIEADDTKVTVSTLDAGKGIQFDDGSGSPPAITGIAVKAGTTDTVEVTLAAAPTGPRKRYWIAMRTTGANTGAVTGARSGIRNTTSYWTDALTGLSMYHWACPEEGQL